MYLVHEAGLTAVPSGANTVGKFMLEGSSGYDTPANQAARVAGQLASSPDGRKWIEFEGIGPRVFDPAWTPGPTLAQVYAGFSRNGFSVKAASRELNEFMLALEAETGIDRTDIHVYTNCENTLGTDYLLSKGGNATDIIRIPAARARFPVELYNLGTADDWFQTNGVNDSGKIQLFNGYALDLMLRTMRRMLMGAGLGTRAYRVQSFAGLGRLGFPVYEYNGRGYPYVYTTMDGVSVNDQVYGSNGARYDGVVKNQKWNAVVDGINRAIAAHSIEMKFIPNVWPDQQSDIELKTLFNAWYRIGVPTVICFWDVDPDANDIARLNGIMSDVGTPAVVTGVEPLALDIETIRVGSWSISYTTFEGELP